MLFLLNRMANTLQSLFSLVIVKLLLLLFLRLFCHFKCQLCPFLSLHIQNQHFFVVCVCPQQSHIHTYPHGRMGRAYGIYTYSTKYFLGKFNQKHTFTSFVFIWISAIRYESYVGNGKWKSRQKWERDRDAREKNTPKRKRNAKGKTVKLQIFAKF